MELLLPLYLLCVYRPYVDYNATSTDSNATCIGLCCLTSLMLTDDERLISRFKRILFLTFRCIWTFFIFFQRFTARCYASAVLAMGLWLCLSVSVTSRSSTKTAKRRITQIKPHDSPGTLVFWCQRSPQNSTGVTEGAECRWGGSKSATFDKWPLYLENGKR